MGKTICLITITILGFMEVVSASKILFVLPLSLKSETNLFFPIAKELCLRGHRITYISPYVPPEAKQLENFTSLTPIDALQDTDLFKNENILENRKETKNKFSYLMSVNISFISNNCHKVYQNKDFQRILKDSYDLIFMSGFFNNCFNGLVHKLRVPFILMTSMPTPHWITDMTGFRPPSSFVPIPLLEFSDEMNFSQRFVNTLTVWLFTLMGTVFFQSEHTQIYRQYLGKDYPESSAIEANVSLIMSNSNFVLNFPRPILPGSIVEVGGVHCRQPEKLPQELQDFFLEAHHGVIYFSLGSIIKPSKFPEATRKIFTNVFSRLDQNVLWKWDGDTMDDLPSNVMLSKWIPQQDVLGHQSVLLFITHGGLLSTQESVYHGKPVLGIPIFVDQDINMAQAEKLGYALTLEISDLTEEKLEVSIREMISNSKYLKRAKELATIFKYQPQTPLQTAVYWVEYILRHDGAPHLRSSARLLNYFQYHCYDTVAVVLLLIMGALVILYLTIVNFCKKNLQLKRVPNANTKKTK